MAARKVEGLLACGAVVHVVARRVGAEVRQALGGAEVRQALGGAGPEGPPAGTGGASGTGPHRAGAGSGRDKPPAQFYQGSSWEERAYRPADLAGRCLVVVATDDHAANRAVAADAEAAGVWVNVADDPDACMFTLPAVARSGPVMLAVSTGGHSPALAGWLRTRLAAQVGPEYGVLAGLLSDARDQLSSAGRSTEGLDWQSALDSDMLEDIRAGRLGQAKERLRACLSL
ncbi:MAG: precorrin-2 dehydrogenase/sirohydrochlorin ferrochelatase family protein [Acidimicrobiales bacterium]